MDRQPFRIRSVDLRGHRQECLCHNTWMLLARQPGPLLAGHVEMLWYCEGYQVPHRQERVLPNGRFQLIIDLVAAPPLVVGIRSRHTVIETAALQLMMGVVFRPGGARAFFELPAGELHNQVVPLDAMWGPAAAELQARLLEACPAGERLGVLEAMLHRRLRERRELHPAVRYGIGEFQRWPHVRGVLEVTRDAGLSRRRFAQLFREQVGLTPKLYCRLHRFQQVVQQVSAGRPVNWADVAAAGGYSDQAHLAHEFRDFAGLTPGAYLASQRPSPNHVVID